MVVGFACQWSSLLLRPDEVLSGIPDALVLEVAYNALGILFQPHHMRIGGLTSFGFGTDREEHPYNPESSAELELIVSRRQLCSGRYFLSLYHSVLSLMSSSAAALALLPSDWASASSIRRASRSSTA